MARKTVMRAGQLNEDTLQDDDKDTKIQVEESADEDKIRFDTAGAERMIILNDGKVGIGTTGPDRLLDILDASNPQLRLTQADGTKYVELKGTAAGDLEISGVSSDTNHSHLKWSAAGNAGMIIQSNAADGDAELGFSVDAGSSLAFSLGVDDGDSDKFKIGTSTIGTNTRLTIDSSGQVGIGTASPQRTLHVETSEDVCAKFHSTDDKAVIRLSDDDTQSFLITKDSKFHLGNTSADLDVFTIDWTKSLVGIGTTSPRTALDVVHDYHGSTFENQLADGQGGGRVLKYSPGADDTLTVGQLYFLHTDGTWDSTDADAVATGGSQLLGVGLGSARLVGVLLEGFVRVPSTEILNVPGSGAVDGLPVYVSTTAGHFDFTAPADPGDFVRVVGYAIDDDSSDVLVYFNPSTTWIEM